MADKKISMLYGLLTSIASKITYDNTESGLTADNVQDAIDETLINLSSVATKNVIFDTTGGRNSNATFTRTGNIVLLKLYASPTYPMTCDNAFHDIIDIPVGYRPASGSLNMSAPYLISGVLYKPSIQVNGTTKKIQYAWNGETTRDITGNSINTTVTYISTEPFPVEDIAN